MINETLSFKKININDKPLFDKYFKHAKTKSSETSFTTLFIWNHQLDYEYAVIDGFLCIKARYKNRYDYCFLPFGEGDIKKPIEKLTAFFKERGQHLKLKLATQTEKDLIEAAYPGAFEYFDLRFAYDYVYKSESLISLAGKKLHSKRNHINKFLAAYPNYEYQTITDPIFCKKITDEWLEGDTTGEKQALDVLFENYNALGVTGCMILAGGKVCAISIGEKLDEETALIQIEKTDKSVPGASNIVNQQFVARQWANFPYINREEDMDIEGLRRAKLSYMPDHLVEKCFAVRK